jgi:hypothetical protein
MEREWKEYNQAEARTTGGRSIARILEGSMNRLILHSRVGEDGILQLSVPIGKADAYREVQVTIDPAGPPPMTQEEWRNFVRTTGGSITDPSFLRHGQGEYERREELP